MFIWYSLYPLQSISHEHILALKMHCNYVKSDSYIYIYIYINWSSTSPTSLAHSQPTQFEMVGVATNAWQTKQNQLKENTLELAGCSYQLSHNTYSNGNGATTKKSLRRGKTKLFKCAEPHINPLFLLGQSPLITEMARVAIKQMEDEKINKYQWKFKSQLVFISSTITPFGKRW
jgi:hypothetical protein